MKTIKLLLIMMLMAGGGIYAQTSCTDLNVYPMTKNKGSLSTYALKTGYEEKAAQTYYYSGPGSISQVRIYGTLINGLTIPLNIVVYNVDANDRPTTAIKTISITWYRLYNLAGYLDVNMGNVLVNANFALAVEIPAGTLAYKSFGVTYNGAADGRGEDLASLAGTSTGNNWTSAKSTFSIDGDFYILPKMNNFITSAFTTPSQCAAYDGTVNFTNTSKVSADSMFNQLGNPNYKGSNYLYTWDFGDNSSVSHSVNPTHKYATAGMYTISLTATFQGWSGTCSDVSSRMVSVGLKTPVAKITDVQCNGDNTGAVAATVSGGVAPYKFSINGDDYSSTASFSALYAGSYTLYAMDSFGCIETAAVTIKQPDAIVPVTWGATNSTCGKSNGAVSVIAKGGTGSLTYSLDGSAYQATGNFTGLAAGHKMITIKDSIGCSSVIFIDVNDAAGPTIKVTAFKNITCRDNKDGSITVSATGGSGTPQYSINGKDFQTAGTFSNLAAGTYGLTVKDDNGCLDIVTVTLTQPDALLFSVTASPATCHGGNNGSIMALNARGGTGNYIYSIDGKTYQSESTFSGLTAGTYTVYMKDANGCMVMVNTKVTEPDQLKATATVVNLTCNGSNDGTITVVVTGGTKPYAYSLDGSGFQPVNTFQGLSAGNYTITIRDANGCFYLATSATITQPTPVTATITTNNATCGNSNGKFLAQGSGGSGSGYTYSIDGGATFNSTGLFDNLKDSTYTLFIADGKTCPAALPVTISSTNGPQFSTVDHTDVTCHGGYDGTITAGSVTGGTGALSYSIDGFFWQSTRTFSGMPAGSYVVRVRDAVGCTGVAGVTIKEPSAIVINVSTTNPACNQSSTGTATVFAAGGNGTMAYSIDGIYYQSSNKFTNLSAGHYTVYVRDAGQCGSTSAFTLSDPAPLTFMATGILHVTCNGANNGAITVYAAGGTGTLAYSIDGANYQASNKFNSLAGGLYTVFIKDQNNCVNQEFVRINEPTALSANVEINNVSCSGGNNGAIVLTANGGTRPYSYQWSNFAHSEDLFDLAAGTYSVTVTDAHGCTYTANYTVTQPDKPLIVNGAIENAHQGSNDGSIKLTITGGTGFFDFQWSNGAYTQDISDLGPGQYTVIVKDVNGCQVSETFQVSEKTGISEAQDEDVNVNLFPNPANNLVTIDANNRKVERVTIMAMDGKIILDKLINEVKPAINTSNLTNGVYIIGYTINGNYYHQRLGIQR